MVLNVSPWGTDVQDIVETLARHPNVLCNGFCALPFQWGQQAPHVSGEAGALLEMFKRVQTRRQEIRKRALPVVVHCHPQSIGHDGEGRLKAAPE